MNEKNKKLDSILRCKGCGERWTWDALEEAYDARMAAERKRYAQLCILVAAQLCEVYGDDAECIATGDACAAAILGTADTSASLT